MTIALSTSAKNCAAAVADSVIIASVCADPYLAIWAMADSILSTMATDRIASRYSV